jgi:hypothetical protein
MKRWSQAEPGDELCHPNAIAQAKAMEGHGYEQVGLPHLTDQEDVMLLEGRAGGVAPARYHRSGQVPDENGVRPEHVFETWPGSPYSDMLPHSETTRQTLAGQAAPRIAIFRGNKPEHAAHGLPLYAARDRLGR